MIGRVEGFGVAVETLTRPMRLARCLRVCGCPSGRLVTLVQWLCLFAAAGA